MICTLSKTNYMMFPIEIVICKCFQLDKAKILLFGKGLTQYLTTNFRLFRIERLCRRHFKFDETGRKLSKPVENTVGKGEIAHYEQFLLFPQCFQKACFPGASKRVIVWEGVNQKNFRPCPSMVESFCI